MHEALKWEDSDSNTFYPFSGGTIATGKSMY